MTKEVVLTVIAEEDLQNVIDYLTYKWGFKVLNNFIDRYDQVINILSEDAKRFPFVDVNKNMQKCILTKHNSLYFIEMEAVITVVTIFDTRQDPRKLTEII